MNSMWSNMVQHTIKIGPTIIGNYGRKQQIRVKTGKSATK